MISLFSGVIFGLIFSITILVLIKKLNNAEDDKKYLKSMVKEDKEKVDYLNERNRVLLNKYLFLIRELNQNPGRIVDLFGSINGTSTNIGGPIEWVVETARKNEEFRELCNDIKDYMPKHLDETPDKTVHFDEDGKPVLNS